MGTDWETCIDGWTDRETSALLLSSFDEAVGECRKGATVFASPPAPSGGRGPGCDRLSQCSYTTTTRDKNARNKDAKATAVKSNQIKQQCPPVCCCWGGECQPSAQSMDFGGCGGRCARRCSSLKVLRESLEERLLRDGGVRVFLSSKMTRRRGEWDGHVRAGSSNDYLASNK